MLQKPDLFIKKNIQIKMCQIEKHSQESIRYCGILELKARNFGGYSQHDPDLEERVLRHIEENPCSNTRNIARIEGISNSTVWTILKEQ